MFSHLSNHVWEASTHSSNTTKCVSTEYRTVLLTYPRQGCQDVEDKLGELVRWLSKLKDSVTTTNADGNREEAERHDQLARFVSNAYRLTGTTQLSTLDC